jgi:hypothetical protein
MINQKFRQLDLAETHADVLTYAILDVLLYMLDDYKIIVMALNGAVVVYMIGDDDEWIELQSLGLDMDAVGAELFRHEDTKAVFLVTCDGTSIKTYVADKLTDGDIHLLRTYNIYDACKWLRLDIKVVNK